MGRPKIIPDSEVFRIVLDLLVTQGEKAVTFGAVSRATGLAGATLVQRFGSQPAMLRMALDEAWHGLGAALLVADGQADASAKGAVSILHAMSARPVIVTLCIAGARDAALRQRAADWRVQVEAALAPRLGGGRKGARAAAMLVATWLGQQLCADPDRTQAFRLKDAAKRLA